VTYPELPRVLTAALYFRTPYNLLHYTHPSLLTLLMEHDPLLGDEAPPNHVSEPDLLDSSPVKVGRRRSFVFCIIALEFCIKFSATLLELPMIRLVESIVCQRVVDTSIDDINEEACKIAAVQNKVAFILGYKTTLDALPCKLPPQFPGRGLSNISIGLLTVLFYGYASNTWGRRPVIMLQISGRVLSLGWIMLIGKSDSYTILLKPPTYSGVSLP
jgi:hypothetical protein